MLISKSAKCHIKNVGNNETAAYKDQGVIKYSGTGWTFIGHVVYRGGRTLSALTAPALMLGTIREGKVSLPEGNFTRSL